MKFEYLPFEKAREYARDLKLSSVTKWRQFCKSGSVPIHIPYRPEDVYRDKGWAGYSDWLGNKRSAYLQKGSGRLDFITAREYVRGLKLNGLNDWIAYCKSGKKPKNIPSAPHESYLNDGWTGYGDWTGSGRTRSKNV